MNLEGKVKKKKSKENWIMVRRNESEQEWEITDKKENSERSITPVFVKKKKKRINTWLTINTRIHSYVKLTDYILNN